MHPPLEITRSLPFPLTKVFELFSHREHMTNWWGPKGMDLEIKTFEFQPKGMFHYVIKTSDGFEMWGKFVYLEIEKLVRITLISSFSNPEGETVQAPEVPFGKDWTLEMWTAYNFSSVGDHCQVKLTSYPYQASKASEELFAQNHDNMKMGFKGTFDKLEAYLEEINP